jgi:Xaa-Pro aminopeptidase
LRQWTTVPLPSFPRHNETTRSYDTEFKFRQDSDFWYLTGFPEPDAIAVIDPAAKKPFTLYVRLAIR